MNVHQNTEHLQSWHLGSAVELGRACNEACDTVRRDGGDPHTVFVQVADGTDQPNLAQLHKRTLTDGSFVYDLVVQ